MSCMHIRTGCSSVITVEKLLAVLPGGNKDIYEDDAEELLDLIEENDAMQPVSAWKKLKVTAVDGKELELNGVALKSPYLAEKLSAGEELFAAAFTAGKPLHQMLADCDDIMQEYILGFLMSHILTEKAVELAEELYRETGLPHVQMIMPGIAEVCALNQQEKVEEMLREEFAAIGISVNGGGSLSPTYSATAFFLLEEGDSNVPEDWENRQQRDAFGKMLFAGAGHS